LQFGSDDEKGDFQIDARGSSALVERDLNAQAVLQMGDQVLNPIFGLDPKKWAEESLKAQRLDPKKFQYDDDKWQEIVEKMLEPPPDTALEVAQIRAEATIQVKDMDNQMKQALETMSEEHYQADREMVVALEALTREMDQIQLTSTEGTELNKLKTTLAETVMTLNTQIKLAHSGTAPEVATPVVEPVGRAPDGQAFQK